MTTTPFPNYLQLPTIVPLWLWHVARGVAIGVAVGVCVLLVASPDDGLHAWWGIAVPLLPALFLVAPGLWRNVCPLAGVNQVPRYLRFTRGLTAPAWFRSYAPAIGMVLFLAAVASREPLFNDSGVASAALVGGALAAAFAGGTVLKGKSGWCSSICPLLGVQRVYGQTPFVTVPNSHCRPCLGCSRNCYDFNPRVAYLADLYDEDRHWSATRKLFVGAFPGLVWVLRAAVLVPSLVWVWRTWRKEPVYLQQVEAQAGVGDEAGVRLGAGRVLDKLRAEQADDPEVSFAGDGPRVVARSGATLLEVIERAGQPIEPGCRMGVCGADPICVVEGGEHLSAMGDDERATIERLGLAESTRMACCARVQGPVQVSLAPERAGAVATATVAVDDFDRSVERVVVIGNGIAGVTACAATTPSARSTSWPPRRMRSTTAWASRG